MVIMKSVRYKVRDTLDEQADEDIQAELGTVGGTVCVRVTSYTEIASHFRNHIGYQVENE